MMATFSYVAVTRENESVTGVVEAATPAAAARALQERGVTLVSVSARDTRRRLREILASEVTFGHGIPERVLVSLLKEWATLTSAGVALHRALELAAENHAGRTGAIILKILEAVRGGASFRDALERSAVFPRSFVALVGAAELSGTLPATLVRAAAEADERRRQRRKLIAQLVYPAFLTVTATAAILVLLLVVVPNVEALIDDGAEIRLPATTRAVLAVSHFVQDSGLALVAGAIAVFSVASVAYRTPTGRGLLDRALLRMPVVGRLATGLAASRYLVVLASLVAGGVDLARALPHAAETVSNGFASRRLVEAGTAVTTGTGLGPALAATGLFPADALGLIRSGEQTGRLGEMLSAAGLLLRQRSEQRLETLAAAAGPMLTICFGLLAGVVVYAMLTTILSVNEFAFR